MCQNIRKAVIFTGLTLVMSLSSVYFISKVLNLKQQGGVIARLESFTKPGELNGEPDKSLLERFSAQKKYVSMLANKNVIWGYGLGSAHYFRKNNVLEIPSHNMFLEYLFSYGLVGFLLLGFCCISLWRDFSRLKDIYNYRLHCLFFGILVLFSLASNTVFDMRILYIFIGYLYARKDLVESNIGNIIT